jgi:hypothetical protein
MWVASRHSKDDCHRKISEICHQDVRPPVALNAEDDDHATKGVTVNLPYAAAAGVVIELAACHSCQVVRRSYSK